MRITPLLIGTYLAVVLTGCHKPQSTDRIGSGVAAMKTAALASIHAQYPSVSASELEFGGIRIGATPTHNDEVIEVSYTVPASATTETEGEQNIISRDMFSVRMSLSGEVESVSKGRSSRLFRPPE